MKIGPLTEEEERRTIALEEPLYWTPIVPYSCTHCVHAPTISMNPLYMVISVYHNTVHPVSSFLLL
jgi:hypothetical protein